MRDAAVVNHRSVSVSHVTKAFSILGWRCRLPLGRHQLPQWCPQLERLHTGTRISATSATSRMWKQAWDLLSTVTSARTICTIAALA